MRSGEMTICQAAGLVLGADGLRLLASGPERYLVGVASNEQSAIPVRPVSEGSRSDHSP
jgi:hypothetical protein